MKDEGDPFGVILRRLRMAAALSQEALADRAELSLRGVSDLERGVRRAPHLATVSRLADALALGAEERQALLAAARPGYRPGARTTASLPSSLLPIPLTPLIGRERELAAVVSLLAHADSRLVTVTGAGGSGKTRLALEAGARLSSTFADGVTFIDLAPLRDAKLVIPTISGVLGVRERSGQRLLDALARRLAARQMLLLLDNCEQVLAAVPEIATLLAAAPRIALLATSREALRVRGERVYPLDPLPLPETSERLSIEEVAGTPAVALFVERAVAHHSSFMLTADNVAAVTAICRRLDGLPLALELAAARIRVLPPAALLARLEQRLPVLTGGSRDLPVRQRTMRDAIAWSYDLLPSREQALFRCLAVFAGGWTLEAATAVSGRESGLDILEGLAALIAANLVLVTERPDGERRFTMLETIREFGMERLAGSDDAEGVGWRHADYYLALAQAAGAALASAVPGAWLGRLEAEQGNLRAALVWLRERKKAAAGTQLAAALGGYWRLHSINTEGRAWLETFLAQDESATAPAVDRVAALRWAGEIAGLMGDLAAAEARLAASLALARDVGDRPGIAAALGAMGSAVFQHVDVAASIPLFTEAVELTRELGALRQTAFLQAFLGGAFAHQGDHIRGEALVTDSAEILSSLGDIRSFEANFVLLLQGWVAYASGDDARAEELLEAALTLGRELDAKGILSVTQLTLAEVAQRRGRAEDAIQHYRDGLIQGWDGDYPLGMAWNLQGLVRLASHRGRFLVAARFAGALDAYRGAMQALPPAAVAAFEAHTARVREAMGHEAFRAACETGWAVSTEEMIVEAVAFADEMLAVECGRQ